MNLLFYIIIIICIKLFWVCLRGYQAELGGSRLLKILSEAQIICELYTPLSTILGKYGGVPTHLKSPPMFCHLSINIRYLHWTEKKIKIKHGKKEGGREFLTPIPKQAIESL